MPIFIHRIIKIRHNDRLVSVFVTQVLIPGTMEYKNMVNVEGKLIPLKEYLNG